MKLADCLRLLAVTFILPFHAVGYAADEKQIDLDWETKFSHNGTVEARFLSAKRVSDDLVIDFLLHNTEKDNYIPNVQLFKE